MQEKQNMESKHKRTFSLHKVREVKLTEVTLDEDYELLRVVGEGSYGRVHLAEHRQTGSKVALKAVSKLQTKLRDFLREFHYSYFLSPHHNILISYDVAFQTEKHFVFAQEYAPYGDLAELLDGGHHNHQQVVVVIDEEAVKRIGRQVASALDFMHSKALVHRDVRPHNILVFERDLSRVKLTDFGLTRPAGTLVKRTNVCLAYMPPEICEAVYNEGYTAETSADVWQLAFLVLLCIRRRLPWQRADCTDPSFVEFVQWQKRKSIRTPSSFKAMTPRLQRMFRRMLHPKADNRASVKELDKYLNDRWLLKSCCNSGGGGSDRGPKSAGSVFTPTTSIKERRDSLGQLLKSYGIETTVDYETKKKRIRDWILTTPS